MPSKKALWAVQLAEFPGSIPMTRQEVISWASVNQSRSQSVLSTLQRPNGIYYRIPGVTGQNIGVGYRYGTNPSFYISFAS